jgi:cell division septum initiation protein DivIVA
VTSDHVFRSDELTPDLVRGVTFAEQDGRVDAHEVQTFLDRVATSLETFLAQDAQSALRAEFARNANIAEQVFDAGQQAAEQMRRQAAEEAKRILDEARDATLGLRETVESEIHQAREQVEAMRGTFIQDLRDLYDRIGASLYRFERAAEESRFEPIDEPARMTATPAAAPSAEPAVEAPSPVAAPAEDLGVGVDAEHEVELPEGAKPPAWRQLPAEAWSAGPDPAAEPDPEPDPDPVLEPSFEVQEDEPLAPGEPLVDLRGFGEQAIAAAEEPELAVESAPLPADAAGSWLDATPPAAEELPPVAPPAAIDASATEEGLGGSWLESPVEPVVAPVDAQPDVARDDALAEALIAEPLAPAAPVDVPVASPAPVPDASSDAMAVRQLILDSLAAGQSREAVETYLRDQLGLLDPGVLVDAALGSQQA